ncbi:MAG TPA: SDR family oxidoreductase [Firmicutes bacterium]|nr:SDR family oxidoreductase [Bacillota bacterium]
MLQIDLKKKTALVTGATGQLGRVMARTLADCGADLIVHYHRNETYARQLAAELQEKGVRTFCVQADVTNADDVAAMKEKIQNEFYMPDILVNNAVIQYQWKPVLEQDIADYESQFKSCVLHNVHMVQAFVPHMAERNYGRVIAINTECIIQCHPGQSAYVAGKRGLDGLVKVLAKEVGPSGITVNEVAPGWTVSEQDRQRNTEAVPSYDAHVPLRRRGTDQEVANVVAFLASDLAGFITGAYIPCSGGNAMPNI